MISMEFAETIFKVLLEPSLVFIEILFALVVTGVYYWFIGFMIYIAWDALHYDSLYSFKQWSKAKIRNIKKKFAKKD